MKQEATGETFPASPQATGGKTDWARVRAMKDANIQTSNTMPTARALIRLTGPMR